MGKVDRVRRLYLRYVEKYRYYSRTHFSSYDHAIAYDPQNLSLSYVGNNLQVLVVNKKNHVLSMRRRYSSNPQINANYVFNDLGPFNLNLYVESVQAISKEEQNSKEETFFCIEPTLS